MSLILEALRKSEAERQIGRAPGLLTPMARPSTTRAPRWPWLLLIAVLIGGASAAAWWLGRQGAESNATRDNTPAAAPASTPMPAPPLAEPETNTEPQAAVPARPAPAVSTAPSLPAAGPSDQPSDPDFDSVERESLPLPPSGVAVPAPLPAPAPATTAAEDAPPDMSEAPALDTEPGEPFVVSLRTLSAAEREALPPLRLNMHVFSDQPQQRFVMIDGRRLAEGESVTTGIVVQQIRRDGAVLDVRGRVLLLERP